MHWLSYIHLCISLMYWNTPLWPYIVYMKVGSVIFILHLVCTTLTPFQCQCQCHNVDRLILISLSCWPCPILGAVSGFVSLLARNIFPGFRQRTIAALIWYNTIDFIHIHKSCNSKPNVWDDSESTLWTATSWTISTPSMQVPLAHIPTMTPLLLLRKSWGLRHPRVSSSSCFRCSGWCFWSTLKPVHS